MIIENQEVISNDDFEDLAATLMGGIWGEFLDSIPDLQGKLLTEGLNLILLSNLPSSDLKDALDPEALDGFTTSELPTVLTNLLVDEALDTSVKKDMVFEHITGNIIETLVKMGFVVNEDVGNECLPLMCKLVSVFFDLDGYEDVIGIADVLDSTDIPPKDRLGFVMERYLGNEFDYETYCLTVDDVSEVTLKSLRAALIQEDAIDAIPDNIVNRVTKNKELLNHTMAYAHVRANGQVGGSIAGFLSFFGKKLLALLENDSKDITEAQLDYSKEVIAFYLVSELNDHAIPNAVIEYLSSIVTDPVASVKLEAIVNQLVLGQ